MIQRPEGTGGNRATDSTVIVRRHAAIGDSLAATCVASKLVALGHRVIWQSHSNIHCVLRRHVTPMTIATTNGHCHVNLDGCYENDPNRDKRHFAEMFMASANAQLRGMGIGLGAAKNCTPQIRVAENERTAAAVPLQQYPRPWVFICPRSNTYLARTILDGTWYEAAKLMQGTKFWIGNHAPAPPGIVDMHAEHLDNVILWLSLADLLVTVDTGPMHIAAALGTPIVAIGQASAPKLHLTDQRDYTTVWPPGLDCLNCQKNVCPKDGHFPPCQNIAPELIASAVNKRLGASSGNGVSAVIVVHRPSHESLNRCISAVINQVNEVVVVRDLAGIFPEGAAKHEKIQYVVKYQNDIGYGRKANYAARHTNSPWLLLLNDDAYMAPNAVAKMLECVKPDTGAVSCLLRYHAGEHTGKIYYAGKVREAGMMGWAHIDHLQQNPTFKEITELENQCGCVTLVRRKAYYDALGHDEDFFLYSEDDALALSMRREGWKLLYTPFACATHENHLSTAGRPDIRIGKIVNESNALFNQKWGPYLHANINRTQIGSFNFDYLK